MVFTFQLQDESVVTFLFGPGLTSMLPMGICLPIFPSRTNLNLHDISEPPRWFKRS